MGTSKGYIAPSTPAWSQAKREVSRYLSNPTTAECHNVAAKYAQAMSHNNYNTAQIANIFSNVVSFSSGSSSRGYREILHELGREDILELPPKEALSELMSHFANDGSTIDDKISLDAISESFLVLEINNFDDLQNIDSSQLLAEMICQFAKMKFAQMFDKQIRNKCPVTTEANARIAEIQDYIYYTIKQNLTPDLLHEINPHNLATAAIVQDCISRAYELMAHYYGE